MAGIRILFFNKCKHIRLDTFVTLMNRHTLLRWGRYELKSEITTQKMRKSCRAPVAAAAESATRLRSKAGLLQPERPLLTLYCALSRNCVFLRHSRGNGF